MLTRADEVSDRQRAATARIATAAGCPVDRYLEKPVMPDVLRLRGRPRPPGRTEPSRRCERAHRVPDRLPAASSASCSLVTSGPLRNALVVAAVRRRSPSPRSPPRSRSATATPSSSGSRAASSPGSRSLVGEARDRARRGRGQPAARPPSWRRSSRWPSSRIAVWLEPRRPAARASTRAGSSGSTGCRW